MKKLIAIVISLIFIFEGTGHCLVGNVLRPRLIYNKALSNEIKIDAVNWGLVTEPSQEPLKLVSSYSGIRGIFGKEEWIAGEAKIITLGFAYTYAKDLIGRWRQANPDKELFKLLTGRETRHTGEAVKELHIAGFKLAAEDMGVEVEIIDLGIVTTPFIESAIQTLEANGGVMITASHNEPEFNGFKYLTGFKEPEQNSLNKGGGLLNPSKRALL